MDDKNKPAETASPPEEAADAAADAKKPGVKEIGGRDGPDPVRYGDWEKGGIAVDF
jgi:hypothetical protein